LAHFLTFGVSAVFQILEIKMLREQIMCLGRKVVSGGRGDMYSYREGWGQRQPGIREAQGSRQKYSGDQIETSITSHTEGLAGALCFASPVACTSKAGLESDEAAATH
jgi:hypothetical protein